MNYQNSALHTAATKWAHRDTRREEFAAIGAGAKLNTALFTGGKVTHVDCPITERALVGWFLFCDMNFFLFIVHLSPHLSSPGLS